MHAVDNTCWDGERGKSTLFDAASSTDFEEPMVTLEVSCWSEADSWFCTGLRGVAWKGFFLCLNVCVEFNLAVFLEVNGGPCHECFWRNHAGHAAIDGACVETENGVLHHAGDHSVWRFFVGERVPCTADPFLHHLDLSLNLWDAFVGCSSDEGESLVS